MGMITLTGLTADQVALLDEMWACDTMEDFDELLETLEPSEKAEALRLQRMVLLAEVGNVIAESPLTEANEVLDKFRT
jgi:hypothetical protein